jgi:hypothetical protein
LWRLRWLGRTVASYRQALEIEIAKWESFKKALREADAEAFNRIMNACRMYASAGSMATRPILLEAMFMSILLSQEREIAKIRERLDRVEKRFLQP